MNIGQASRASGVSTKMIRYYEQTGLIPRAARRDSGYRDYDKSDVHRLHFIRRARDLGFTVEQIGELLALWSDRERSSADVKSLALGHVERLRAKQVELEQMIDTLETLARDCHGDDRPDCPIIEGLAEGEGVHCSAAMREAPRFGVTGRLNAGPAGSKSPR
ncbi:MAG TPA: Cu(I)-responsive transcriptional regulator [Erythrobacter sp.]|nr:Cu(I)-responsive transcriptional regulator [Erythrobacter sp.]